MARAARVRLPDMCDYQVAESQSNQQINCSKSAQNLCFNCEKPISIGEGAWARDPHIE